MKEEEFLTQFGLLNFEKTWQKKKTALHGEENDEEACDKIRLD